MSAYCYYLQSPRYNLDQEKTYIAIDELQLFISNCTDKEDGVRNLKRCLEIIITKN